MLLRMVFVNCCLCWWQSFFFMVTDFRIPRRSTLKVIVGSGEYLLDQRVSDDWLSSASWTARLLFSGETISYPIDLYPARRRANIFAKTGISKSTLSKIITSFFAVLSRLSRPAYCVKVPRQEIGSARNRVRIMIKKIFLWSCITAP